MMRGCFIAMLAAEALALCVGGVAVRAQGLSPADILEGAVVMEIYNDHCAPLPQEAMQQVEVFLNGGNRLEVLSEITKVEAIERQNHDHFCSGLTAAADHMLASCYWGEGG